MNSDTSNVEILFMEIKVTINKDKPATLEFNRKKISNNRSHKHLGLLIDEKLNFKTHINKTLKKAAKSFSMIYQFKFYLKTSTVIKIYK